MPRIGIHPKARILQEWRIWNRASPGYGSLANRKLSVAVGIRDFSGVVKTVLLHALKVPVLSVQSYVHGLFNLQTSRRS